MKFTQRLAITYVRTKFRLLSGISARKTAESAFELFCTPYNKSKKQATAIFNDAEPLQFKLDNHIIKGFRWNHPQAKKVLIAHGFSSCTYNFDKYISAFIKKGYEVLAFDAPAHGQSSGKTVNAVQYADVIRKISELYGPVDYYMGHSFGGIAVSLAIENLPHGSHTKIVLIAPATETSSAIDGAFKMLGISSNAVRKEFDDIILRISGRPTSWFSIKRAVKQISAQMTKTMM